MLLLLIVDVESRVVILETPNLTLRSIWQSVQACSGHALLDTPYALIYSLLNDYLLHYPKCDKKHASLSRQNRHIGRRRDE
jgi:hypothetical protein